MIEKFFKKFINRGRSKPFSAWQIELTTRCPLRCQMCIRTGCQDWQFQDMSIEGFKKILPYLGEVENVILEGWGESLLYKNLSECIRWVKSKGPQVGFVTCGKGLGEEYISELINAGLDFIGFSIAGTTPETHASIRINSNLSEILNAIQIFQQKKLSLGISRPKMHFVFLMLKENIHEVPKLPALAERAGIGEILLTHIIHIATASQEEQRVFSYGEEEDHFNHYLKKAEEESKRLKVNLKRPPLFPVDPPICEENPLRNLYISSNGEVSPCVYLNPPLPSPFKRIFRGREYWVERVSFGNIFEESFLEIWNKEGYFRFREAFREREKKFRDVSYAFLSGGMSKNLKEFVLSDPPEPCKTCHKILGF